MAAINKLNRQQHSMTFTVATGFSAKVPIFLSLPLSPIIAIALYAAVSSRSWNMIFVAAFPAYGISAILYDPWGSVYDLKLFMEKLSRIIRCRFRKRPGNV